MDVEAIPLKQVPERFSLALSALKSQAIAASAMLNNTAEGHGCRSSELIEAQRLMGMYKSECDEIMRKVLSRGNENYLLSQMTDADLIKLLGL